MDNAIALTLMALFILALFGLIMRPVRKLLRLLFSPTGILLLIGVGLFVVGAEIFR